jgi:PAS domain S-box-containing protein
MDSPINLGAIINTIPTAVWTTRPDGYCDFINQVWLDFAGMTAEQAQGWGWAEAIHPDDRRKLVEEWQSCLASGTPVDAEARIRRCDGSHRWFLIRANPLKDESGNILKWYGTNIDIEDRKRREEALRDSELSWRQIIDNIPGFVHTTSATGEVEFLNQQVLEYFGKSSEELKDWSRLDIVHPDDLPRVIEAWRKSVETGQPYEVEQRNRRADGVYRWVQSRGRAVRNPKGEITAWYWLNTDIEDRKKAEEALQSNERNLSLIINTMPTLAWSAGPDGSAEFFNQHYLAYVGLPLEQLQGWGWKVAIHPDDVRGLIEYWQSCLASDAPVETEARMLRFDGAYRWFLFRANALRDESGTIVKWYGTNTDIDDRKRTEQELKRSEEFLAEGQRLSRTGSFSWRVETDEITWSDQLRRIFEFDDNLPVTLERIGGRVYPDDLPLLQDMLEKARGAASYFEYQHRLLMPDQSVKHIHLFAHATRDKHGRLEYVGAAQDVTDLYTITDAIANPVMVLTQAGAMLYANRVANQWGLASGAPKNEAFFRQACHSDDIERIREERRLGLVQAVPFQLEVRLLKDGKYRWQLIQHNPLKDASGSIVRWYATATDIDDQKKTEERLRNENIVLREQIDRDFMSVDIVGSSEVLRKVLRQVAKVAPSDSTVLILGETGTGKELVARAIHTRSNRAERAFIGVNCAAIPQSLIASELFGHEKGAFTGATQRRLGRFESANGGTIFLDEVGDLPMEIQIALLRVLQEREIERVGASKPIPVDVRVLAATHRDLNALVDEGEFRQDLLYRLNVVPIVMPSLRERKGDVPLLVEYFIDRFGKKAGKKFRTIDQKSFKLLQSYDWPGNVRELQNVIERAVILCEDEIFSVDETWLGQERPVPLSRTTALNRVLLKQEKEMIEAALAESQGQISGPTGAATKLGLPARTLDSKIKRLRINKYRFKVPRTI